jgi:hypothetical protein
MIMMPYGCPRVSPQVTVHADFWHPTGATADPAGLTARAKPKAKPEARGKPRKLGTSTYQQGR